MQKGISVAAVICAAGSSSRMGGQKKEYLPLPSIENTEKTRSVIEAAVSAFASSPRISFIVAAAAPGEENTLRALLPTGLFSRKGRVFIVPGGPTRRVSVHNALSFLEPLKPTHVLIHDGARPWVETKLIESIIDAAIDYGAVIPVLPLIETPKELSLCLDPKATVKPEFIKRHLNRNLIWTAQTPQGFKFPEILKAHEKAKEREEKESIEYTDDAEIWGEFVGQVAVVPGDPANKKITYPEDLKR